MSALSAIHVAKKQLGLDEDTYRAVLVRVTGKDSTRAMDENERKRVVEHFRKEGFKPVTKGNRKLLTGPYAGKLQALWIGLWNLGAVRNRDDAAMLAFIKRQTGIDHARFLTHAEDARKAVEALKAWLAREGVDWSNGRLDPPVTFLHGFKIALVQIQKLSMQTTVEAIANDFPDQVYLAAGRYPKDLLNEADWHPVMNAFGKRIRAAASAKENAA